MTGGKQTNQVLMDLISALEADKQEIDDKNVDTAELEAMHIAQANAYLAARKTARNRVRNDSGLGDFDGNE